MDIDEIRGTSRKAVGGAGKTKPARSLNHRVIEGLKPEAEPYRVPDTRCAGLAIRVSPKGAKTWDLAFRIKGTGKGRRVSLGAFGDVSLDAARDRAAELTRAARAGRDLIAEEEEKRTAEASRVTVGELIERYLRRQVNGRLRTADDIGRRLKRALGPLLNTPAETVHRRNIRDLLDEVADRGNQREADKRRQAIATAFKWAVAADLVDKNPAADLPTYGGIKLCDRVLTEEEVRLLWRWLDSGTMPPAPADVLRLQLALGARCGEIGGIRAEEIDQENWFWTLPQDRSKNGKSRLTPLVGLAREIIQARLLSSSRGPLFISESGKPLTSSHVGHFLLNRLSELPIPKFVTHDLRRTVASLLAEMGVSLELVAAIVGHETGSRETRTLVRHYVRTDLIDRKRVALEAWDIRLIAIIDDVQPKPNVRSIRAAKPHREKANALANKAG